MIKVHELSKAYKIFDNPADRLKQSLYRGQKKFYKEFWPLTKVSFSVEQGEIVGLVGANGSGKSTLLQVICGILQPTSGEVRVTGRVAALLELGSGFNAEFNGHDNLLMNAALLGLTSDEIQARYADIVAFADIGDFLYQPVKTYSSGMVVRLAFAISSFVDADILVVDEALAVGDVGFQAKCLERMERLMQQGTTVLLVTHDVQLIKRYCNRVLYLHKGCLVYDGEPEEGTEIYLAQTRERAFATHPLELAHGAQTSGVNYASQAGYISAAILSCRNTTGQSIVVGQGERIQLNITAKISHQVEHPRIQMTVRDNRGYNLFGFNNYYSGKTLKPDAEGNISVRYSFDANLQIGDYAITLRLDDCDNVHSTNLIDKQVGIADFTVTAPAKRFDAVIDLNGCCEDEF